jgi:Fe2+ transport system protein FeoA
MKKISLIHIKANRRGKVADILGGTNIRERLMHMGVHEGREIVKLSHIGLRGPVVIKAGRTIMALGHGVAAKVILEQE